MCREKDDSTSLCAKKRSNPGKTRSGASFPPPLMLMQARSLHRPSCQQPDYCHNHGDHQNNMDQASGHMERESEKPQDE